LKLGTFARKGDWYFEDLSILESTINAFEPHAGDITRADQEPLEMLGHEPASWRASEACSKALGAIRCLNFHTKGAKHVDSPACS